MDVASKCSRWQKALSVGSSGSSEATGRCTDLNKLDMETLTSNGMLTRNALTDSYSGWVYVALSTSSQVIFKKRFCILRELVCKFYLTADDSCEHPIDRHVIISVHRVHSRNKTFAFTDYEDRTVLLHTCMGADFEYWYGTFATIVKATQVAKAKQIPYIRRATTVTPRGKVRHIVTENEAQRLRALTAPMPLNLLQFTAEKDPEKRNVSALVIDDDPERTHTVWLYVQAPWWHPLLMKQHQVRRYFVFSGTMLSYFSMNKEGKRAIFTHEITSFRYNCHDHPTIIEVECGHRNLRLCSKAPDGKKIVAATVEYIQRALNAR